MPFGSIRVRPGVNTVATPTLNEAGISDSNLIRFRMGLPEKMGGWQKFVANAMASVTRELHAWEDFDDSSWLASGNLSSLKVMTGDVVTDITPQELITNGAPNLSTTAGTSSVAIIDASISNLSQYSAVYFNTPISIGGICLSGLYALSGAGTLTAYTIDTNQVAASSVLNSGTLPTFTTTANSAVVTVTLPNHGLSDGESFYLPIAVIVGGVSLTGAYDVFTTATNTFQITSAQQATSAATVTMNAGSVQYRYLISSGPSYTTAFGAMGPVGEFAVGEGFLRTTTVASQTGTPITATDWTLDNWGEILLACPKGGAIYYWPPSAGFNTAIPIGTGPPQNNGIFVSMPQQILCAYGSAKTLLPGNLDSSLDRLVMRWSDANDFGNWRVSFLSLAGSFHLGTGSRIVGAIQAANYAYVFTDIDVYTMSYANYPLVFAFNQAGTGCGLIGPHAVTSLRGVVYWMSNGNFYFMSGAATVQSIPCPVWDDVFQDLDAASANKSVAGANSDFDEIFFFYPSSSGGTGENDKYAKLNVKDGIWDVGSLPRSAWTDRSILGSAIGADPTTTLLQQHEVGYSDDGSAMNSFFETGYFAYESGEEFGVVDHFEPDMKWATLSSTTSASVTVDITAVDYPNNESGAMTNSLTMSSTTNYLSPRVRGRQMKWRVGSNDATSWWRHGNVRYRYGVDGRR